MRVKESKHHQDTSVKEVGPPLQISLTTIRSVVNTMGRICVSGSDINELLMTETKAGEIHGGFFFFVFFGCVHMVRRRLAILKHISLCSSNW